MQRFFDCFRGKKTAVRVSWEVHETLEGITSVGKGENLYYSVQQLENDFNTKCAASNCLLKKIKQQETSVSAYTFRISGTLNGKKVNQIFNNFDAFRQFIANENSNLIPQAAKRIDYKTTTHVEKIINYRPR